MTPTTTSPRGVITQYQRDGFGQTVKLTSPDSGKTQYQPA
jgi:YD repeat-containing protein